jgi:ABC-type antimicrobial peptide transport system permease subunit
MPGVELAALTSSAPFTGFGVVFSYSFPGQGDDGAADQLARFRIVTPELFATLGIPVLRGRTLDPLAATPSAVVSDDFVSRHFGDVDPLGRRFAIAGDTFEIVGVVPAIRDASLRDPSPFPFVYVGVMPAVRQSMSLVLRASGDPAALSEPLRQLVRAAAPTQPITPLEPMHSLIGRSAARPRFILSLLTFFAAATLVLAAVGLHALLAWTVGRRTREIGVRLALGAPVAGVRRMILRQAFALAALGTLIGAGLALWGSRLLESLLFQVESRDPGLLFTGILALGAVTALAAWLPARRATRVAPVEALRSD